MATLNNLVGGVENRLEETPGSPIFWNESSELYPLLVEACNLATLITGEPQFYPTATVTIPATSSFTLQAMPAGALAITRIDGPGSLAVQKCYVQDLDHLYPGWEVATGDVPQFWVPFGLDKYGIVPNLTAPVQVLISYIGFPVASARPYTGAETVPFQNEYLDAIQDYACAMARLKEGDPEFSQGMEALNRFLSKMEDLSNFAYRKGSLRFSRGLGVTANIVETRVK